MPPRVLVIEDDQDVSDMIRAVLESEGYTVAVARDGADGLLFGREWRPDLILLDINLPKVQGETLLRLFREDDSTRETPMIAMSASATIRRQSERLRAADAALSKPFDIETLLAQVAFHLARRPPSQEPE